MEASAILPLRPLYPDLARGRPGTPDALMRSTDQCDRHPTLYVFACPRVGLLTLCREASGYVSEYPPSPRQREKIFKCHLSFSLGLFVRF